MNRNLNPEEFSDEQLEEASARLGSQRQKEFGSWKRVHEDAGFAFDQGEMRYEYGATPDFTSWGGGPPTIEGGAEPEHVYRVEGSKGVEAMRESGELASRFGLSGESESAYTHVSRYPEGKYVDPGSRVLRIQNEPGRFRAKTTLDRAYAVAEKPIPASDVEDLGDASKYPLVRSGKRASTPPVDVFDYFTPSSDEFDRVESERVKRRVQRSGDPFDLL